MSTQSIKIVIDDTQARAQLAALQTSMRGIAGGAGGAATGASNLSGQFVRTGSAAQQMAAQINAANSNIRSTGSALGGLSTRLQGATAGFGGFRAMLGGFAGGLVAGGILAIAGALGALVGQAIAATAQVETFKASLTTVIGDATKAGQAFDALADFAAKTPFSLDQAVNGFIKLKALGLTPSEAAMTSYGNTAAAMGKDLNQMIEAVADASTGEFERLKEFGIKARVQGDQVALTFQGVTTKVGNNSAEIQAYLMGIGNTNFAGAMERQSKTLAGAMSNLKDQVFLAFAGLGTGLSTGLQDVINGIASGIQKVTPLLTAIGNVLGSIVDVVFEIFNGQAQVWSALFSGGEQSLGVIEILTGAFNLLAEGISIIATITGQVFSAIASIISTVAGTVNSVWSTVLDYLGINTAATGQSMGLAFMGVLRAVKFVATNIPAILGASVVSAANIFITAIEGMINKAISGLNALLALARKVPGAAGLLPGAVGSVSLGRVQGQGLGAIATKIGEIANDNTANSAAINRLFGRKKAGASLDSLAGSVPAGSPGAGIGAGRGAGAGSKAQEIESAAEKYQKLITAMKEEVKLAGMLSNEAEVYKKQQEAKAILGKAYTDEVQGREIANLIEQKKLTEALTAMRQTAFTEGNQALVNQMKHLDLSEEEMKIEDALSRYRLDHLNKGGKLADLTTENWKLEEQRLAAILRQNAAYDAQRDKMADLQRRGADLIRDALKGKNPIDALREEYKSNVAAIMSVKGPVSGQTQGQFDAAQKQALKNQADLLQKGIGEITMRQTQELVDAMYQVGDSIGGKLGDAINGIARAVNAMAALTSGDMSQGGLLGGLARLFGADQAQFAEGAQKIFGPIKDTFNKLFGEKGTLIKGLSKTLGQMSAGAQIGSAVAGIGQLFWKKFSNTGAQVGGALGSVFGPVGSIIGSIAGGIIGGLLKKTKQGYAIVSNTGITGGGNSQDLIQATQQAGEGLQGSIAKIAETLGGTVGSYAVSIAKRSSGWIHVDGNANPNVGDKKWYYKTNSMVYNGKDEAEAMRLALLNAIQDGAIQGIRAGSQRLLQAGKDIEAQLAKALRFENAFKELAALTDPVTAAAKALSVEFDGLKKIFTEAGATAQEWADLEKLRTLKVTKLLEDSIASLTDFQKALSGDGSGLTDLTRLNTALAEFAAFRSDIAAGKSVAQAKFTSLGQDIFGLAGNVYGTSTNAFQDIRAMLMEATAGAITNTQASIDSATVTAINNQTQATVGAIEGTAGVTNELLRQQNELLARIAGGTATGGDYRAYAMNGAMYGAL